MRVDYFEHAGVELDHVYLGKLPNMVVNRLGQASLEILQKISHEGGAAGDV